MGYTAGEALVLAQLQAVAGFTTANTSRAKWLILNSGNAAVYGILRKGPWAMEFISGRTAEFTWTTIVEVWQRWVDDGTTQTNLEAAVDAVIARFLAYRKLGDTTDAINDSNPRRGAEPAEMWLAGGNGPSWLRAEVEVEWKEQTIVTFAE